MRKLFTHLYAPSTLGSFLRAFTFGPVRQLDAIASRFLINLAALSPLIIPKPDGGYVLPGRGRHNHRGPLAPETRRQLTLRRPPGMSAARILSRADSALYTFAAIHAALAGGADISVTARTGIVR